MDEVIQRLERLEGRSLVCLNGKGCSKTLPSPLAALLMISLSLKKVWFSDLYLPNQTKAR